MKKAWRVVLIIALAAIVIGAILIGVGLLTGANTELIYSALNERYHIEVYYQYILDVMGAVRGALSA